MISKIRVDLRIAITSGRNRAQPLPRVSMDWVISSSLNCVLRGWRTSAMRAAWLAYIRETYPDGLVEATQ